MSNITVPLLGLIDAAIVGHLGAASYIGAIAVGGMLFNIIYWIFGFLRMGTSGMTSQAYGQKDEAETMRILARSMGVGMLIALALIILQYPIERIAFTLMKATPEVERLASLYFRICIWGAPAVLGLYSISGWCIGMQNSRFPMYVAITQNIVNILASLALVYGFGMKIEGVAIGTLVAQYAGLLMAAWLWTSHFKRLLPYVQLQTLLAKGAIRRFFQVNRDIFFRTLCLVAVTMYFTSAGAAQGEVILAVNTLLMHFFTFFSYIMDGFAYAGEALVGKHLGANDRPALRQMVHQLFVWGIVLSLVFTLVYGIGGKVFLGLITNEQSVITASSAYFYWVLAIPLAGFAAFLYDGIFIGATASRHMRDSMLWAVAGFALVWFAGILILQHVAPNVERYGNIAMHILMAAYFAHLLARTVYLSAKYRELRFI